MDTENNIFKKKHIPSDIDPSAYGYFKQTDVGHFSNASLKILFIDPKCIYTVMSSSIVHLHVYVDVLLFVIS